METKIEKRKVDFVTLEEPSVAGTSKKTKSTTGESDSSSPNEITNNESFIKYLNDFKIFPDKSSEYYFANDLVHTFLLTLLNTVSSFNFSLLNLKSPIANLINALQKMKQLKVKFFNHSTFRELLKTFGYDVKKSKSIEYVVDHLTELTTELSRICQTVKPNETVKNGDILKKIKALTNAINRVSEQISKAENATISPDDMQNNTQYTKLPLLYKAVVRLWKKREMLRNQSDNSGRIMFKSFKYQGTSDQKVNSIIEKYFINYLQSVNKSEENILCSRKRSRSSLSSSFSNATNFEFFSIIDLKNHLQKQFHKLDVDDFVLSDELLEKIYKDLLLENKDRRLKQQSDAFKSIQYLEDIQPETVANDRDPQFIKEIEQNEQKATESMEKIIEEYRQKDYDLNGKQLEGEQIGWDDNGDEEEEDDNDNEDEEDDNEQEEEDQQIDNNGGENGQCEKHSTKENGNNESNKIDDNVDDKHQDNQVDDDDDDDVILCED